MYNIYIGMSVGFGFILFCLLMAVILMLFRNFKRRMLPGSSGNNVVNIFEASHENKRKHERMGINWPVVLDTESGLVDAETKDISLGGAFIICSNPLFPGEKFKITINIPDKNPIKLNSEVVWSNSNVPDEKVIFRGMGIRFIKNRLEDCENLKNTLSMYIEECRGKFDLQVAVNGFNRSGIYLFSFLNKPPRCKQRGINY